MYRAWLSQLRRVTDESRDCCCCWCCCCNWMAVISTTAIIIRRGIINDHLIAISARQMHLSDDDKWLEWTESVPVRFFTPHRSCCHHENQSRLTANRELACDNDTAFVLRNHHCCSSAATSRRHCFSHRTLHHSVRLCVTDCNCNI